MNFDLFMKFSFSLHRDHKWKIPAQNGPVFRKHVRDGMARKRHSDEDVLKLLREIELKLTGGSDVASACRSVGISDATYYDWRKRFGGMDDKPDLHRTL